MDNIFINNEDTGHRDTLEELKVADDNTVEPVQINWSQVVRRDEILSLWQDARNNGHTHQDLLQDVINRTTQNHQGFSGSHITEQELKDVCTQIRNGLMRQLAKYKERANSATGTEFEKNMAAKAEARIPTLLPGSGGTRARYDNMFSDLINDISEGSDAG